MKKLHFFVFCAAILLSGLVTVQAVEVPLKKSDDPNAYTSNRTKKSMFAQRMQTYNPFRSSVFVPFEATIENNVFYLDVIVPVGTVQVAISNEYGEVEYAGTFDSAQSTEFAFGTENWSVGYHKVTISYGAVILVGEFSVE